MKTIYIDEDFHCHVKNADGRRAINTDFFDDKCDKVIEKYRFVPYAESWIRNDGMVFHGEMICPAVPYETIKPYQEQYTEDCENMMSLADVADLVELVYEDDLGIIG